MKTFSTAKPHMTLNLLVSRYCDAINRYRLLVIAASVAFAGLVGLGTTFLTTTTDNRVFFGSENPELRAFEALEATYAEGNNVLIAIAPDSGDVFERKTLKIIQDLTKTLWQAPYSTRIDSLTNFQHSRARGDELIIDDLVPDVASLSDADIRRVRDRAMSEPMLKGLLISERGDVAGINANFLLPRQSPEAVDEIVEFVRQATREIEARHPDIAIHITGNVMLMAAFGEASDQDIASLIPIMFVVIAVILLILMRSLTGMLVALSLAGLSSATAMGFAGWTGVVLNAGSGPAPLIILTMALAYSVHVLTKFLEDYRAGATRQVAIINSVESNLSPVFLTSVTTAIGFLSMNLSDAPPFHDLGTIVAVGVIAAFVFSFTFVPAALALLPIAQPKRHVRDGRTVRRFSRFVIVNHNVLFWATFVVIGALATGVSRVEFNDNWVDYFDRSFEFRRDTDFVLERLTGIDVLEYSVPAERENGIFEPKYLATLDRFTVWLGQQPEVVNVSSLSQILKRLNMNMHGDDPDRYTVPQDKKMAAQYLLLYELSLPNGLDLNDRVAVDRSATRVTVIARRNGTNLPSSELRPLTNRIEAWLETNGGPGMAAKGSGLSLMFASLSARNIETMLYGTGFAMLLISGILIIALRSVRLGLVSLVPNFVPAVMGFGLWGYLVGEIGVAVSVVAAMTFGIVVDDTIHFLTNYIKGRRELGKTPEESIEYAFRSVGKALLVTTLVLVAGFCVLATSGFKVSSSMGLLTAITLALALAADFLFLTSLLLKFDKDSTEIIRDLKVWRPAPPPQELPNLVARIAAYRERIKDGHPVKGKIPGSGAVELWSNDYLSLNDNPAIVRAQVDALERGRNDVFMSAALLTDASVQHGIERQIADFVGAEAAVLCQSGWAANVGLIQAIADADTPVYIDIHAHASLWEGARAAGAAARAFRHNNAGSLESQIKRHGPGVIVVDSIYSADGSICPLREITEVGERNGCVIVVDESHSVGVYGRNGQGLVPLLGLSDKVHYRTFSLSKAVVTRAGVVTGPARVMDYFPYESRPAIFSSAVLPHELAGLAATLQVLRDDDWRRQDLWSNARYLRSQLSELGYNVDETESQVIALEAGPEHMTIRLRQALEERGVFGAVFCAPATPKNHSLIRLSVNCGLSRDDLDHVVEVCRSIRDEISLDSWPSTARKRKRDERQAARSDRENPIFSSLETGGVPA